MKDPSKIDYFSTKSGLDKKLLSKRKKKHERGEIFQERGGGVPLCSQHEATTIVENVKQAVKVQDCLQLGAVRKSGQMVSKRPKSCLESNMIAKFILKLLGRSIWKQRMDLLDPTLGSKRSLTCGMFVNNYVEGHVATCK